MNDRLKYLFASLLGVAALSAGAFPAAAATSTSTSLGTASSFAVLSAAPVNGGAVTCTNSTITGDVGSSGESASVVAPPLTCTITGEIKAPVLVQVLTDFNGAYDALAGQSCDRTLNGTLDGVTLAPGVYCFKAAAALTGTLTLDGPSTGIWIFKDRKSVV